MTPLMKQYTTIKRKYQDSILLFRMGDFYETFFDDAKTVARELNIVLTSREKNKGKKIPLAGVPHHAVQAYISRLIQKGYRVAICDQVEDPKLAKGLVKRDVTRVITPGTILEDTMLKSRDNNYLMSLVVRDDRYGIAAVDISTGEFSATEGEYTASGAKLSTELARYNPSECIIPESMAVQDKIYSDFYQQAQTLQITLTPFKDELFDCDLAKDTLLEHFQVLSLEGLGCQGTPLAVSAAGAILNYLQETQMTGLNYINKLNIYSLSDYMILDATSLRNLELIKNIRDGTRKGTLLDVLDRCATAMGSRLLRKNIQQPLLQPNIINDRLDAVEEFADNIFLRQDLREQLVKVYDLERLISRVVFGNANARDLLALKQSFQILPLIKSLLKGSKPPLKSKLLKNLSSTLPELVELANKIDAAIVPEPPVSITDGGIIKTGYNDTLDELKIANKQAKSWISSLEAKERRRTSIQKLRVGYNKVFGYYIEVRKTHLNKVPQDYIRKQTLVNAERFITEELKEKESVILSADERSKALEHKLFLELRESVAAEVKAIQKAAYSVAQLDMLIALAEVAINNSYTRPIITEGDELKIKNGRHPVVEHMLDTGFVPNDSYLNCIDDQLIILTGPNMAGKSTYMRQIALIVILAQLGSFVPAEHAEIGIVDRIFTRVGAFDDLTRGQSTFMVEMLELANILNTATNKSLILLDEVGRGTSTFDGLSIAWAVCEFIHNKSHIGAKTLFATHYHHLNELEEVLPGVKNYNIAVKEDKDKIIFLYKVKLGGTNRSYGIQVARLAGLPLEVIDRAKTILARIEAENLVGLNGTEQRRVKRELEPNAKPEIAAEMQPGMQPQIQPMMQPEKKVEPEPEPLPGTIQPTEYSRTVSLNSSAAQESTKQKQLKLFIPLIASDNSDPILDELRTIDIKNLTPLQALNKLYEVQKKLNNKSEED
ncbi:DNA mismatch repair protein MutS [[Eubacterium] cellulosolvens]